MNVEQCLLLLMIYCNLLTCLSNRSIHNLYTRRTGAANWPMAIADNQDHKILKKQDAIAPVVHKGLERTKAIMPYWHTIERDELAVVELLKRKQGRRVSVVIMDNVSAISRLPSCAFSRLLSASSVD